MRLLIVATDYPPKSGGIATYGYQLARALSFEHDVTVLATGVRTEDEEQPFAMIRSATPFHIFSLAWELHKLLNKGGFDAVLHTTWPTSVIAFMLHRATHPPYFVSVHASEILDDIRSWRRKVKSAFKPLKMLALRNAAGLFPVSHYTQNLLRSMGLRDVPIRVINNGVDVDQFEKVTRTAFHTPPRLLTVARLDLHKGHDIVLKALAELLKKKIPFEYWIVGSGDEEENLKKMAHALKVEDRVRFFGFVPDTELSGIYSESDVFIMLSREIPNRLDMIEGFGISFLEASAAGLPVIAGNSGGVSDAVIDGETGVLVEPENVKLVEEVLLEILSNVDKSIEMGCAGRQWVESKMRWGMVASRLSQAMQELISSR